MEEPKYKLEYNPNTQWHIEWRELITNRTDFNVMFSVAQKEHFEKLLAIIEGNRNTSIAVVKDENSNQSKPDSLTDVEIEDEKKFLKYRDAYLYISNLFLAVRERALDENYQAFLKMEGYNELLLIYCHYYYNEYLDESSKKVADAFLNPTKYNHSYELNLTRQFFTTKHTIQKRLKVSIYDIDKVIIEQMDTYKGGEKEAFLEYQLSKCENQLKRLKSWKGYIKDLAVDFKNPSSYELGLEFVEEHLSNSKLIKLSPPLKVGLSVPQLALFYRLLHDVEFYKEMDLKDIFGMLNKAYATKAKAYPAFQSLSKSIDKLEEKDVEIIQDLINRIALKAEYYMKAVKAS